MNKDNEKLDIDLFHGTSSIFIDSIAEFGLGGQDISKKYHLRETFEELIGFFKKHDSDSLWWAREGFICEKMMEGSVSNSGFNFRYGGVYLTPSIETAKRYATSNKYGSELASYCIAAYEEVKKINPEIAKIIISKNSFIHDLINSKGSPVVLKINGVTKENLTTEQGNSIDAQLIKMRNSPQIIWQQFNFECKSIIPWSNIEVLYIN